MNKSIIITLGAVLAAAIAWFVFLAPKTANEPKASPAVTASAAKSVTTITYSDSGFSPAQTTVKSGDAVTFKNTSSSEIQVDSDPHPVHTDDSDLNVGAIAAGASQTVTLTKTGTFGLHNHFNPTNGARITIQ